jgi:uncharacterized protein
MLTPQQSDTIKFILQPFQPRWIGVFGSVARGEECPESDLDILVHFDGRPSLFDLMDLEEQLHQALHKKVDLITERSLHESLKKAIESDLIYL